MSDNQPTNIELAPENKEEQPNVHPPAGEEKKEEKEENINPTTAEENKENPVENPPEPAKEPEPQVATETKPTERSAETPNPKEEDFVVTEHLPHYQQTTIKTIQVKPSKEVIIDIPKVDFSSPEAALKNGFEAYYETVKKGMPELPALDLILSHYTYYAYMAVGKKNEPTGIFTVIRNFFKYLLCRVKYRKKIILDDINLCFPAGTNTIILGTPGCGTTSLLDALGGRNNNGHILGKCQYGGKNITDYKWNRLAIVCEQLDFHNTIMTVRETMKFAKDCLSGPKSFYHRTDVEEVFMKDIDFKSEVIIQSLGLMICAETIVGDNITRGVSGGERRRVTLGEILVGPQRVILLDKFSTGLDSAVTIDIVRMLQQWAKTFNGIVVAAMLQPDPEMLDLYDQLILLEKGVVTYAGPTKDCIPYLESFGYSMPEGKDAGSFISEMGSYSFREDCSPGNPVQTLDKMRKHYEDSEYCKEMNAKVERELDKNKNLFTTEYAKKVYNSNYSENIFQMFYTVLYRQCQLLYRDKLYIFGRWFENILLGVILGCVFIDLPDEPVSRTVYLFFFLLFITFGHFSQIGTVIQQKEVMKKQLRKSYYSASMYVLSSIVCQYPLAIIETFFVGIPLYFFPGLSLKNNSEPFWIYHLCGILMSAVIMSLIRMIIMMFDSESVITGAVPLIIFICGNLAGLTVSVADIPWVLRWIYYIDPYNYAMKILIANEYYSGSYDKEYTVQNPTDGTLTTTKMFDPAYSHFVDLMKYPKNKDDMYAWFLALLLMHILYVAFTMIIVTFKKITTTISYVVDDEDVKKLNEQQRQESLQQVRSSRGSLVVEQVTLSFRDLCYFVHVKDPITRHVEDRQLLDNVSGFIRPNTFTALMGSSGAGKTTLLDVLANKKNTGKITGNILFNGQKIDKVSLTHYLGYVEQADNLPAKETVQEALEYSAEMRLPPGTSKAMIKKVVKETLTLLDLTKYAGMMIGKPGNGLSMAIRKLVMTGIELVANPPIIFLDEPTTGLDSNSALLVVQVLERVAATGRSVICTIHQPSFEIFKMFTDILLLERGGRMIYLGPMGENSKSLVEFLEGHPDVPKLPPHTNPAAWMLEVTGGGVKKARTEMASYYLKSDLYKSNTETLENIEHANAKKLPKLQRYMASYLNQLKGTFGRVSRFYWRSSDITLPRIGVCILIGILMGVMYWDSKGDSIAGIQAVISAIFICGLFIAIIATSSALPGLFDERPAVYREIDMNFVRPSAYVIAYSIMEIPFAIISACLSSAFLYPMVGFKQEVGPVFYFLISFAIIVCFATSLGQVIVYTTPTLQVGLLVAIGILAVLAVMSGYAMPLDKLWILFKIIYWIDPVQYYIIGAASDQLYCGKDFCGMVTVGMYPNGTAMSVPIVYYLDNVRGLDYDRRWLNLLAIVAWILILKPPFLIAMHRTRFMTV